MNFWFVLESESSPIRVAVKQKRCQYIYFNHSIFIEYLQEMVFKTQTRAYGNTSKSDPISCLNSFTKHLDLLLKIGINGCKLFKLNKGFISFRTGFHVIPAKIKNTNFFFIHIHKYACTLYLLYISYLTLRSKQSILIRQIIIQKWFVKAMWRHKNRFYIIGFIQNNEQFWADVQFHWWFIVRCKLNKILIVFWCRFCDKL